MKAFLQADPLWSKKKLGHGSATIGRAGCLLCAIAQAACIAGKPTNPNLLNQLGQQTPGCFAGSNTVIPALAKAAGLVADTSRRVNAVQGADALKAALTSAISAGELALLHVDHGGSDAGDHWILAIEAADGGYLCTDSATGGTVVIGPDLDGVTRWGKVDKRYHVRAVFPFTAASG